tara:strand:- start:52421 stop:52624 length:204 start_codon:yes stop_codon:yes gene_type:complete
VDDQRVLAHPSDPRALCEFPLGQGRRIDESLERRVGVLLLQFEQKLHQPLLDELVVVFTTRVPSDPS